MSRWLRGTRKTEATGLDGTSTCSVCGLPLKVRVVVDGQVVEDGETVWFEAWSVGTKRHLACCDAKGAPLEEKRKKSA